MVLLVGHATMAAQDVSPEQLILSRSVAVIRQVHPEWNFVPAICSGCPPLTDEQLGQVDGSWWMTAPDQSLVGVTIHRIRTADAARRWLDRHISTMARGWTAQPYKFGDGASLATYPDPRGFTQYNMVFRKGRFVVRLSARSQETIELFAQIVLTAIAN